MLDTRVLEWIRLNPELFEMGSWHGSNACGTTHCRAGTVIHLAGPAGAELERKHGSEQAGYMIYRASKGTAPYFYGDNKEALADIERCAAEEQAGT
jgi:hypothetical protein